MVDTIELSAGTGGAVLNTDDIGGVHTQVNKLGYGALDSLTLVTTAAGLPVQQQSGASFTVANGGTFATQVDGAALTALQLIDNLVLAEDAAHQSADPGVQMLGVRDDTLGIHSGTDGDYEPLHLTAAGRLYTSATVDAALPAGDNNIGNVDVASSALPAGASTSANQTTIIGHLDGVEGLLTTIDGDTSTLAGAVSGTELQVDVVAALPAGTNNIGDVDVASSALPTGAATLAEQQTQTTSLAAIETAVEILDNAVSGSEMQVDVVAALPAGTNNIGDVDIASIAAGDNNIGNVDIASAIPAGNNNIGDVDVASIAAGTNVIGRVAAIPATGAIYNGTASTTPVFVAIDHATSGDNTLVAAQGASNKVRVYALYLVSAGTTTVRFESGTGGTALSGQVSLVANVGFVLPFNPLGWFETAANTLLNLELSAAVSVDGGLVYSVVT